MRKGWLVLLAMVALVVFAVPAVAEVNLTGFIRTKAYVSNYLRYDPGQINPFKLDGGGGEVTNSFTAPFYDRQVFINTDNPTSAYVEERGRLKFEAKGENVGAVAFFEIDMRWGDNQNAVARNQGGGIGADSINLETKNLYVWFKPSDALAVNVGLQSWTDAYRGVLFGYTDLAGVFGTYKMDPAEIRFGWGKIADSSSTGTLTGTDGGINNDVDLFVLEGHMAPTKDARLGLDLYWIKDHKANADWDTANIYTIGVDGAIKADVVSLSAFAFMQFGKAEFTGGDVTFGGFSADVRADAAVGPGKAFLEALYVSGSDPYDTGDKFKGIINGSNYGLANALYTSTDMEILLPNIDDINSINGLVLNPAAPTDDALGLGMIHVGAGFTMPLADKMTGKLGLGYSRFVKAGVSGDSLVGSGIPENKDIGFEINAKLNYNLAKGLDLTGIGAYALLGGAYDVSAADKAAGYDDPDNLYKLMARLNYAF